MNNSKPERLDKIISKMCGVSRSEARKMIWCGEISINGEIIKSPEHKADFSSVDVSVNGKEFKWQKFVYIMMNKPADCVCTSKEDTQSILHCLPPEMMRDDLFCVGRLDKDTTGLILITNDGGFSHKIISPKAGIKKSYIAQLDEPLSVQSAQALIDGIELKDGEYVKAISIDYINDSKDLIEICIDTGKYHQVKRMLAAVDNRVISLERKSIGGLILDSNLSLGQAKHLNDNDINLIFVQNI